MPRHSTQYRAADRLLTRAGRQGGAWVVLTAAAAVASAGGALALPAVLGGALDALFEHGSAGPWLHWCALLVALLVVAEMLDSLAAGAASARSTAWLRHSLWHHVLGLGARRLAPGDVASRLVGSAAQAGRVAPDVVRTSAALIPAVGGTVALGLIDPWLCLTFLAGLPVFVFAVRAFARDASDVATRYFDGHGTIAGPLLDAMARARTMHAAST